MTSHKFLLFTPLLFLLGGCGPNSLEDYREEGGEKTYLLIKELKMVKSRDQLLQASPRITKLFNDMTQIMIAAREFKEHHPDAELPEPNQRTVYLSYKLRCEMDRIYEMDGCREIMERCQEEALLRLDAFEKRLQAKMT